MLSASVGAAATSAESAVQRANFNSSCQRSHSELAAKFTPHYSPLQGRFLFLTSQWLHPPSTDPVRDTRYNEDSAIPTQ